LLQFNISSFFKDSSPSKENSREDFAIKEEKTMANFAKRNVDKEKNGVKIKKRRKGGIEDCNG
jgi:hypothetical protein